MIKYAYYIRVSTDREEQASSLENQKVLFDKYIENNSGTLFKIYQDIESGTSCNRDGLNELIEDAKNHKFNAVLIKEWSRLSRNTYDSFMLKNIFEELNIKVICATNGNNALEESTLLFAIQSALAQGESEKISERTKQAFLAKFYRGEFKGSRAPFAYEKCGTKLVIRKDNTPDIVRSIFNMYLDGFGADKIAKYLNKNQIPTPAQVVGWKNANSLWHGSAVDKILTNKAYIGCLVQHKTTTVSVTSKKRKSLSPEEQIVIEGTHEPILDEELFYKVQDVIKLRHKERRKSQVHMFSNFLYCSHCGKRLHYKANRKGYVCAGYNRHGKDVCTSHYVREDILQEIILGDFKAILSKINNEKIIKKLKKQISLNYNNLTSDIENIDKKINNLEKQKNNAKRHLVTEVLSANDYKSLCHEIDKEIKEFEDTKIKLLKTTDNGYFDEIITELDKLSKDISDIVSLNPKIINELIEKIVIDENGQPKIYYKFSAEIDYLDKLLLLN